MAHDILLLLMAVLYSAQLNQVNHFFHLLFIRQVKDFYGIVIA